VEGGEGARITENFAAEAVTDKVYHSNETAVMLEEMEVRSYMPEPDRKNRDWEGKQAQRDAVYANRRRARGRRGRRLLKRRGQYLERSFAHCYETGGLRRLHVRGRENIHKRLLGHVAGFNLSLVMRKLIGKGTPRGFQGGVLVRRVADRVAMAGHRGRCATIWGRPRSPARSWTSVGRRVRTKRRGGRKGTSATGC